MMSQQHLKHMFIHLNARAFLIFGHLSSHKQCINKDLLYFVYPQIEAMHHQRQYKWQAQLRTSPRPKGSGRSLAMSSLIRGLLLALIRGKLLSGIREQIRVYNFDQRPRQEVGLVSLLHIHPLLAVLTQDQVCLSGG